MKVLFFSIFIFILLASVWGFFCKLTPDYTTPIATLKTLKRAIKQQYWQIAKTCFSQEMQEINREAIEHKTFYEMPYWTNDNTLQQLFHSLLIIEPDAEFEITEQDADSATVKVTYKVSVEKDMRLNKIELIKEDNMNWKISKINGLVGGKQDPLSSSKAIELFRKKVIQFAECIIAYKNEFSELKDFYIPRAEQIDSLRYEWLLH